MFNIGWRKVFSSFDISIVGKVKEQLEHENIKVRVKSDSPTQQRIHRDVMFGGNPMVINSVGLRPDPTEYLLYVPKENAEEASIIIQRMTIR